VNQPGLAATLPATDRVSQRRTIPFDYQFHFEVYDPKDETRGFRNQLLTTTVTVSIEAAFVAVSIGYGFIPRVRTFTFGPTDGATPPASLQFGDIVNAMESQLVAKAPAGGGGGVIALAAVVPPGGVSPEGEKVLLQGIQINPALMQRFLQAYQDTTTPGVLNPGELTELFQAAEPPPDRVQFLYALSDKGTGRSFQIEPLLNTAGLGIIDGDRPFRYFATPIVFPPRSTIQLDVIPKTNFHADLYFTLHGYKVLGGIGTPTGHKLRASARVMRMR
jgi:hypothetical protein